MGKVKLGELVSVINERVDNPAESKYERFVGLEHYDTGSVKIARWGTTELLVSSMKAFCKGDILVARRNVYLKRASCVDFDGITSGDSIVLRVNNTKNQQLIPFVLNTEDFWDYADKYADGTMSKRLSPAIMLDYEFNMPEDNEKATLSKSLWAIERTKDAYKALIEKSDELVKSQFVEMFGDGKGCTSVRLDEVAEISSGLTKNPNRPAFSRKMKYLRVANVFYDQFDLEDVQDIGVQDSEVEKTLLAKGDVLFVEGNGSPDQIGRVAVWDDQISPMLHQNHIIKVRPDQGKVLPRYVMHYFMTQEGRTQIIQSAKTTSGLYTLSLSKIAGFKIPLPSLEAQKNFIDFVSQSDKSKFVA